MTIRRGSIWTDKEKQDLIKIIDTTKDFIEFANKYERTLYAVQYQVVKYCKDNNKEIPDNISESIINKIEKTIGRERNKGKEKDNLIKELKDIIQYQKDIIEYQKIIINKFTDKLMVS